MYTLIPPLVFSFIVHLFGHVHLFSVLYLIAATIRLVHFSSVETGSSICHTDDIPKKNTCLQLTAYIKRMNRDCTWILLLAMINYFCFDQYARPGQQFLSQCLHSTTYNRDKMNGWSRTTPRLVDDRYCSSWPLSPILLISFSHISYIDLGDRFLCSQTLGTLPKTNPFLFKFFQRVHCCSKYWNWII